MAHIAVQEAVDGKVVEWLEQFSQEEYERQAVSIDLTPAMRHVASLLLSLVALTSTPSHAGGPPPSISPAQQRAQRQQIQLLDAWEHQGTTGIAKLIEVACGKAHPLVEPYAATMRLGDLGPVTTTQI